MNDHRICVSRAQSGIEVVAIHAARRSASICCFVVSSNPPTKVSRPPAGPPESSLAGQTTRGGRSRRVEGDRRTANSGEIGVNSHEECDGGRVNRKHAQRLAARVSASRSCVRSALGSRDHHVENRRLIRAVGPDLLGVSRRSIGDRHELTLVGKADNLVIGAWHSLPIGRGLNTPSSRPEPQMPKRRRAIRSEEPAMHHRSVRLITDARPSASRRPSSMRTRRSRGPRPSFRSGSSSRSRPAACLARRRPRASSPPRL